MTQGSFGRGPGAGSRSAAYRVFHRWPRYPGLFLQMAAAWVLAPLLIRVLPLPGLLAVYTPRRRLPRSEERLQRIPRYFKVISRRLFLGRAQECLRRCLVLFYFLNRWGEPVVIRFGVRTAGQGKALGHSWLTRPDGSLREEDLKAADFAEIAALHVDQTVSGLVKRREA